MLDIPIMEKRMITHKSGIVIVFHATSDSYLKYFREGIKHVHNSVFYDK